MRRARQDDVRPAAECGDGCCSPPVDERRGVLATRIRWLVAATITYNAVEAVVALVAGTIASSTALIGFGLDSVIEVASAATVAWQFSAADHARREQAALRVIALSFFALAAFVAVKSARALLGGATADHSPVGIVLAAVSLVVMPVPSAALLTGLVLNGWLGWWWADPAAALVIAAVAAREGRQAWQGQRCC